MLRDVGARRPRSSGPFACFLRPVRTSPSRRRRRPAVRQRRPRSAPAWAPWTGLARCLVGGLGRLGRLGGSAGTSSALGSGAFFFDFGGAGSFLSFLLVPVSSPARLNWTSFGSAGIRESASTAGSKSPSGGATGMISSALTSFAKKRVASSASSLALALLSPHIPSHSEMVCGRSSGRTCHRCIDRGQELLPNPGQRPSASGSPSPPWSRSSTSGGFSPVMHS